MSTALSLDLRVRVLASVEDGASHREAAARFGVSAASVSRWRTLARRQGDARSGPLGGDRRTGRVEAQARTILGLLEAAPDITIEELRRALADRGLGFGFGYGTIQRFLIRHDMTRKKRLAMRASRIGRIS
jgi:transposase